MHAPDESSELLRGIVHTLNTVVMPDLRSPWPQMVTLMTSRLLEHLIAREEGLAAALHARIPELRALLAERRPGAARARRADTRR